jgi:syntaxin 1B/2/3
MPRNVPSQGSEVSSNSIFDEISQVQNSIQQLEQRLNHFEVSFSEPGEISRLSSEIINHYRDLVERVTAIESKSDPKNASQVRSKKRKLVSLIQLYQTLLSDFRKHSQTVAERQYRIVDPEATDTEVQKAVSSKPNAPIFQHAVSI